MPSALHEAIVAIFRGRPKLAAEFLVTTLGVRLPSYQAVRVVESTLTNLKPVEYRADLVIDLTDGSGATVLAILVETQLDDDPRKTFTWPVYVSVLRERKRCPVCLLVIAPDAAIARWSRKAIELGPGTGFVTPMVLGPENVPVVVDRAAARQDPELAVLSALAHGNDPSGPRVLMAMLGALGAIDEEQRRFYINLVASRLTVATRATLEAMMMTGQANGELIDFMGQIEAKLEARGEARALLTLLAARGLSVNDAVRTKILACMDLPTLDRWISLAATAPTVEAVLADP